MAQLNAAELRGLLHDTVLRVEVHLPREFMARRWLFLRLIRLACWVLGCGVEVVNDR